MTLNQLKNKLIGFFESHGQVNSVKYEKFSDFNAERNLIYPAVNIEWISSNQNGKATNRRYNIIVGDKVDYNVNGIEADLHSDAEQIAIDFFTWARVQEGFNLNQSSSIAPFSDDTHDRVSGVRFQIELSVIMHQNECAIPSK